MYLSKNMRTADCTICFGMSFINSGRGMSVPTTPNRIPWFFCMNKFKTTQKHFGWNFYRILTFQMYWRMGINTFDAHQTLSTITVKPHTVSFLVLKTGMATVVIRLGPTFSFSWERKRAGIGIFEFWYRRQNAGIRMINLCLCYKTNGT